jgi:sigma-B regulation protein RsbU (phosphoserine phosphatase)
VGKTDFDFVSYEHAQQAFEDEQRLIQTGTPILHKEEKETWPDGTSTWVSSSKLPIRDERNHIIGLYGMSRDITERRQSQIEIARYTEQLKEMNQRLETDLAMAGELQRSFLPQSYPVFPPHAASESSLLQFAHYYHPTGNVGGDFFTVLPLGDYKAGIFFSDVMGHGVRSALVTALLRSLVSDLAPLAENPGTFLTEMNGRFLKMVQLDWESVFATACLLTVDLNAEELHIANAGHLNPLLIKRLHRSVTELVVDERVRGAALGLSDRSEYNTRTFALDPHDVLFLYTDGLYEVEGEAGDFYDTGRLSKLVSTLVDHPMESLIAGVLQEVRAFKKNAPFEDDVCMLAVEIRESDQLTGDLT